MYNSKRFIAFIVATLIFLLITFTTDNSLMDIALAVSVITTIYIGADTIRKSDKDKIDNHGR